MSNSSVPLLSAHSITKSFGPRTARHQVLFDVSPTSTPANVWP